MTRILDHLEVPHAPYGLRRPAVSLAFAAEAPPPPAEDAPRPDESREEWKRRMDAIEKAQTNTEVDSRLEDMMQAAKVALESKQSSRKSELLNGVAREWSSYAEEVSKAGGKVTFSSDQLEALQGVMAFKKRSEAAKKSSEMSRAQEEAKRMDTERDLPTVVAPAVIMPKVEAAPAVGMPKVEAAPAPVRPPQAVPIEAPPASIDPNPTRVDLPRVDVESAAPAPPAETPPAPEPQKRGGRAPKINLLRPTERPAEQAAPNESLRQASRETQEALNMWKDASEQKVAPPPEELERLKQAYRAASERLAAARETARARRPAPEAAATAPEAPKAKGRLDRRQINLADSARGRRSASETPLPMPSVPGSGAESLPSAPEMPDLPEEYKTLEEIKQIGEQKSLGFWDRWKTGFAGEWSDWKAGINTILAARRRDRLAARNTKIEEWQKRADELNKKGTLGRMAVLMFHEGRILANKRAGAAEYAKWAEYDGKRATNERAGDELRAFAGQRSAELIAACENRANEALRQSEIRTGELDDLYVNREQCEEQLSFVSDDAEKDALRSEIARLDVLVSRMIKEKSAFEYYRRSELERATAEQRQQQEILVKSDRSARPDTTPPPYEWLSPQTTRNKVPLPAAQKQPSDEERRAAAQGRMRTGAPGRRRKAAV